MQAGVVAGDGESGAGNMARFGGRPSGTKDGVLGLGAAGAFAAQVGLEFDSVFTQIVQQAGEVCLGAGAEGGSESCWEASQ